MNKSIYGHEKVKVLEFMVENVFRKIIKCIPTLIKDKEIACLIPEYLKSLSNILNSKNNNNSKLEFINDNLQNYIDLTEDCFWTLVTRLASKSGKNKELKELTNMLLKREIFESTIIENGKEKILEEALKSDGLLKGKDFCFLNLETTIYKKFIEDKKEQLDEKVFVIDFQDKVQDVSSHSEFISSFRDKPEKEKILVFMESSKRKKIKSILKELNLHAFEEKIRGKYAA